MAEGTEIHLKQLIIVVLTAKPSKVLNNRGKVRVARKINGEELERISKQKLMEEK